MCEQKTQYVRKQVQKYTALLSFELVFLSRLWYNIFGSNYATVNRDTGWLTFILTEWR